MHFHISSALLNDENAIALNVILHMALNGAVLVKLGDAREEAVIEWLDHQPMQTKKSWQVVTDATARAESRYRNMDKIKVVAEIQNTDWKSDPPRLTLQDAAQLAGQPKRIILENARADRKFLLSMADDALRGNLIGLETKGRLTFTHAGGIGELKKQLNEQHIPLPGSRYFCWVLIDSDAPNPGQVSHAANEVLQLCEQANLRSYCLKRRAIENYIPRDSMLSAMKIGKLDPKDSPPLVEAFFKLNDEQRNHFHMKQGLDDKSCSKSGLYDEHKDPHIKLIKKGIPNISSIYDKDGPPPETLHTQFKAVKADQELSDPFKELKSMIRGLQ